MSDTKSDNEDKVYHMSRKIEELNHELASAREMLLNQANTIEELTRQNTEIIIGKYIIWKNARTNKLWIGDDHGEGMELGLTSELQFSDLVENFYRKNL